MKVFWVLVEEGSLPVHVLQAIKHIETVLAALGLWVFLYRRNMRHKHLRETTRNHKTQVRKSNWITMYVQ